MEIKLTTELYSDTNRPTGQLTVNFANREIGHLCREGVVGAKLRPCVLDVRSKRPKEKGFVKVISRRGGNIIIGRKKLNLYFCAQVAEFINWSVMGGKGTSRLEFYYKVVSE